MKVIVRMGIFRGLSLTAARDSIYVVGMLGVTPFIQNSLVDRYGMTEATSSLPASLIGGVLASVPSHPLDVLKTIVQGHRTGRECSLREVLLRLGVMGLFRGCMWRTINITATVYIANEVVLSY